MDRIVEFLEEKNYHILTNITLKNDSTNSKQSKNKKKVRNLSYSKEYKGVNKITKEFVSIKISNLDQLISYDMVKYESNILSKMNNFYSTVKLIDRFDMNQIESIPVFIIITQFYDKTLENLINEIISNKNKLDFSEVLQTIYGILYSLSTMHSNGVPHNNISPSSIIIDSEKNFRFRDFISLEHLDTFDETQQTRSLLYRSPDHESNRSLIHEDIDLKKKVTAFSEDIYSLGVIIIELIGIKKDEKIIQEIMNCQKYLNLNDLVESPDLFNILSFVKSHMLFQEEEKRYTVFQLKRLFRTYYEKHIPDKKYREQEFEIINWYQANNISAHPHLLLMYKSIINLDPSKQMLMYMVESYQQLSETEKNIRDSHYYVLYELSHMCDQHINYEMRIKLRNGSLEARKALFSDDHQLISNSLIGLGHLYYFNDEIETALPYYLEAHKITDKLYGRNHPVYAEFLTNFADCNKQFHKFQLAFKQCSQSLQLFNSIYLGDHSTKIEPQITLGNLSRREDKFGQSLDYQLKVLQMRTNLLPKDHQFIAQSLRTVGFAYKYLGNYEKAIAYHHESLIMRERLFPEFDSYVLTSLFDLADSYKLSKNCKQAFVYLFRIFKIYLKHNKQSLDYHLSSISECLNEFDHHLKLKYLQSLLKVSLIDLQIGNNRFLVRLLNQIEIASIFIDDYENLEEIENLKIKLQPYLLLN